MKPTLKELFYAITMVGVIVLSYPGRAFSQDTVAKKHHSTMIVKIESDENGKKTVLDTTINLDQVANMKDLQEFMKKYDVDMRELTGNLADMEINISRMRIPDSALRDSIRNFTKNIIIREKNGRNFHYRGHDRPDGSGYNFDFELPELPDLPEAPEMPFLDEWMEPGMVPPVPQFRSFNRDERTLSDVLGDIPMSSVKSYTVKERKNGKKIVIELNSDPVFEKHDRVMILREPRHRRK